MKPKGYSIYGQAPSSKKLETWLYYWRSLEGDSKEQTHRLLQALRKEGPFQIPTQLMRNLNIWQQLGKNAVISVPERNWAVGIFACALYTDLRCVAAGIVPASI